MIPQNDIAHDRSGTIKAIRTALKARSGKQWSVTGGTGTAWGWIKISAPPSRLTAHYRVKEGGNENTPGDWEEYENGQDGGHITQADRAELGQLLGLDRAAYTDGESIPASSDYRREYIDRAEGRAPSTIGKPYWD